MLWHHELMSLCTGAGLVMEESTQSRCRNMPVHARELHIHKAERHAAEACEVAARLPGVAPAYACGNPTWMGI